MNLAQWKLISLVFRSNPEEKFVITDFATRTGLRRYDSANCTFMCGSNSSQMILYCPSVRGGIRFDIDQNTMATEAPISDFWQNLLNQSVLTRATTWNQVTDRSGVPFMLFVINDADALIKAVLCDNRQDSKTAAE